MQHDTHAEHAHHGHGHGTGKVSRRMGYALTLRGALKAGVDFKTAFRTSTTTDHQASAPGS
ncbi:hypothetical protein [Streptomyces sp. NPDC018059]|uniref:hypothetical protein n=1 Tax=Streptomyces sp. NPDC018059 TaxID=3365041 RepID=UPI0037A055F3